MLDTKPLPKGGGVWYNIPMKVRRFYEKSAFPLPWQDSSEFRKVLVPLRKFHL